MHHARHLRPRTKEEKNIANHEYTARQQTAQLQIEKEGKKVKNQFSNCTFRSCDLRVMSPARFHCAKLLFLGDAVSWYDSLYSLPRDEVDTSTNVDCPYRGDTKRESPDRLIGMCLGSRNMSE
ncbi:hypothetical protein ACQKWADRAFT_15307 [Trichoderma austrokoningii]